jgi:hypothetical protein
MSLTVTVRDEETGETATRTVQDGDYVLVCAPPCRLDSAQAYANGTHVLTVKDRRASPSLAATEGDSHAG